MHLFMAYILAWRKNMYSYKDIEDIHLEVTSKCQAKCPMCPRRINGGILNPLITLDEITLEQFKDWFPIDFVKQLRQLVMCGNLGDPIAAQDTVEIFRYLRENNKSINLKMHTNGSGRTPRWWIDLALLNVEVIFGIDGLQDTNHLYRINTDYEKIIFNAQTFIEAGGNARWDMLIFEHNEHQIDACKKLSQEMGFKDFQTKHTTRFENNKFHVLNEQGKTINILYPTEKSKSMIEKAKEYINVPKSNIVCKAKKYKQLYVSATGNVAPCCWLDFDWILPKQDTRVDYMDRIGHSPSLKEFSLENIFESKYFREIEKTWVDKPLLECSKQCGNFDKLGAQFEN